MKLPLEEIADFNEDEEHWEVRSVPEDPEFLEIERANQQERKR